MRHTEREQEARSSGSGPHHAPHVVIIGGGIAGMATAYALQERARAVQLPLTCTLVEASGRLGGAILTERVDGFVIEAGPDSLLTQKPWGVELCRELGIGDRLISTNDQQRKIYILWQGRLQLLPEGLMLIVPTRLGPLLRSRLLTWPGKIRMACEYLLPPRPPEGDESLAAFVRRRLGREALERIATPLLAGIYAGSLDEMSLLATFPRIRELEAQHGGLIRGMLAQRRARTRRVPAPGHPSAALFVTPRQGMGELVEALTPRLAGVTIVRQTTVKSIRPQALENRASIVYEITGEEAPTLRADAVVLATPAHVTARLVEGFHPELAKALSTIPYVSTATISLAYRRTDVAHPLDGFGFLVARDEPCSIIGATWTSTKFPHRAPAERVLIRCFVGGVASEHLVSLDDAALVQLAREALQRILGITAAPLLSRLYRWEKANPQYQVGHLERVEAMETMLTPYAGLFLTGSAYHGIGVPDCIHHGTQTAERVLAALTASR